MARIIEAIELFSLNSVLRRGPGFYATQARQALRDISLTHHDLTVANVASKLSRPVRVFTPGNNGSAA